MTTESNYQNTTVIIFIISSLSILFLLALICVFFKAVEISPRQQLTPVLYRYSSSSCEYQQDLVPHESPYRKNSFNLYVQADQQLLQLPLIFYMVTYSLRSNRRGKSSKRSLCDMLLKRWITRELEVIRHLYPFFFQQP